MLRSPQMKIAALLPHVEIFGGVRRYIEIGNALTRRDHEFVLFHPEGYPPSWLTFEGRTEPFSSLLKEAFDIGLCSEYSLLLQFEQLRAQRKYFYFLLEGHKREKEVIRKNYVFLGNSEGMCRRIEKKYGVNCLEAAGGINTEIFHPIEDNRRKDRFTVLCYGRIYRKRKGTRQVIRAVERLYRRFPRLRLLLFDSLVGKEKRDPRPMIRTRVPHEFHLDLPQSRMAWLYSQADVFISAERRAGWSNTTAEAMACRVPVICTLSGTRDFAVHEQTALVVILPFSFLLARQLERLVQDEELRHRLALEGYKRIRLFTWGALAERLESIFQNQ